LGGITNELKTMKGLGKLRYAQNNLYKSRELIRSQRSSQTFRHLFVLIFAAVEFFGAGGSSTIELLLRRSVQGSVISIEQFNHLLIKQCFELIHVAN
jgi:hypothetical protein